MAESDLLPDTLSALFSREPEDKLPTDESDEQVEATGAEDEVPVKKEEAAPAFDVSKVDYDRLVRQRDAIIRDKQREAGKKRELSDKVAELEKKLAADTAKKDAPGPPDPKVDPIGHLEHNRKAELEPLKTELEALKSELENRSKEFREELERREVVAFVTRDEQDFRAKTPDFDVAMQHLDKVVYAYCLQRGLNEEEAITAMETYKQELLRSFLTAGKRPAEGFYEYSGQLGHKAPSNGKPDPRIAAAKRGASAGSLLASAGKNSSKAAAAGDSLTLEDYMALPVHSEVRMAIASNKGLFKQLHETGEVVLPA